MRWVARPKESKSNWQTLAFSSSLWSKDEEETQEGSGTASGAHKSADVRGTQIGPQSGVQMPKDKTATIQQSSERDAPTTTECKAPFGKEAGEGGNERGLPRIDKARDQERERHGTPVELTRNER